MAHLIGYKFNQCVRSRIKTVPLIRHHLSVHIDLSRSRSSEKVHFVDLILDR